ncbi:hypothetical protein ACGFJ7_46515 [Actinoplanes sp. NPDC048988]|uniref:hypothetical protein n=1 Tax=Actinoplanes sp. NPDC048988 TaxID=3363901 RepID=UPI00371AD5B5
MDRRTLLGGSAALALAATLSPTPASAAEAVRSLDGRPFPDYDYSRANKLPREMTGWWTKSFGTRTARIYISPETPIRSYFTVIAVPKKSDAVLREWRRIADEREEGLFVLEPGPGGWGTPEEEAAYVEAALAFFQSNRYFSIFGLHYLVGYGAGGPALEAWAVAHPLRVIAQAYVGSSGLSKEFLDGYAPRTFGGETDGYTPVVFPPGFDLIRYDETVLPTLYADPDRRSAGPSLAYWRKANSGERWMTSHAGPIAKTVVRHGT